MFDTSLETSGIFTVDSHYTGELVAAIYVMIENDEVAIIETGTSASVEHIEKVITDNGLNWDNVKYVIPTHVHLDHSAGAGVLMQKCCNANLVIHPRGARHMVDPSKLIAGATAVYGEYKFRELYGEITPIDERRIIEADDNFELIMGSRKLVFIDTPGHARHHFCVIDNKSGAIFTGDTFGISYREFDQGDELFILPTTTPVQFDPAALKNSIDRIMDYSPSRICLTHFGVITPTRSLADTLKESVDYFAHLGMNFFAHPDNKNIIEENMMNFFITSLKKMGYVDQDFIKRKLATDVNLNTQGIIFWQEKINNV